MSRENDIRGMLPAEFMGAGPLYKQVKRDLVVRLNRGEWRPGEALPSEQKLSERYSVGISTVRAAVGELVAGKILARKQGKGTFVSLHDEQRSIYQFFHVVPNNGVRQIPVSELISFSEDVADNEVSDMLRLPRAAKPGKVFKLRTVMRAGEEPITVSDIVLPAVLFKGMTEGILRESYGPFSVYQRHFGITIIRTESQLRAVEADAATAKMLRLIKKAPVLEMRRVAFTFEDVPVEVRFSRIETSRFYFQLNEGDRA